MFEATLTIKNRVTGETSSHAVDDEHAVRFLNSIEFTLQSNSLDELQEIFGLLDL